MVRAFDRDFQRNGPSTMRIVRTTLAGWKRYKNHPDARIRRRFAWEARELATTFSAAVAGARSSTTAATRQMHAKMSALLADLQREFGWKSRLFAAVGGRVRALEDPPRREAAGRRLDLRAAHLLREERRLPGRGRGAPCRYVTPQVTRPAKPAGRTLEVVNV